MKIKIFCFFLTFICVVISCREKRTVLKNGYLGNTNDTVNKSINVKPDNKFNTKNNISIDEVNCIEKGECDISIKYTRENYEIFKFKNLDNSIEITAVESPNDRLPYVFIGVDDLVTGSSRMLIIGKNINDSIFYITDQYDPHAVGDHIDPNTLSFKENTIMVMSALDNQKKYSVKISRLK